MVDYLSDMQAKVLQVLVERNDEERSSNCTLDYLAGLFNSNTKSIARTIQRLIDLGFISSIKEGFMGPIYYVPTPNGIEETRQPHGPS